MERKGRTLFLFMKGSLSFKRREKKFLLWETEANVFLFQSTRSKGLFTVSHFSQNLQFVNLTFREAHRSLQSDPF